MSTSEEQHQRRHGHHSLIPAGALIGLGAGLIANYPVPGIFIGIGLGFLAQGFLRPVEEKASEPEGPCCCGHGKPWISLMIGLVMIIIGVSMVWSPVNLWPYIIGIILIMLGIMFAAKSWCKAS